MRLFSKHDVSKEKAFEKVAPKEFGKLDMVIAFDTTGSMAAYIGVVRKEVADLIPRLFCDNEDLRLGIVAFGDYCDMDSAHRYGRAYQCLMPTDNVDEIVSFVENTKDTSGGDGDEFYELVLKKIVEETPWRADANHAILLIADSEPHPLGYSYRDYVVNNQIDWRREAKKAAEKKIKVDTVTITDAPWFKELSRMTNGISAPFESGYKTGRLVEAATLSRGSMSSRRKWDEMRAMNTDEEMEAVFRSYQRERDEWREEPGVPEHRLTPTHVTRLARNEVFVFGSNSGGFHRGGASGFARKYFGAVWGQGEGLQGHCYAIPSVDGMDVLATAVARFTIFARKNPGLRFLVTAIGCGVAGLPIGVVAPLFRGCVRLENVTLPKEFWEVLND